MIEIIPNRALEEGSRIYYHTLRAQLERDENLGKVLAIDVDTGDYEMGEDGNEVVVRLRAKHPASLVYRMRIGSRATYTMAGPPRSAK